MTLRVRINNINAKVSSARGHYIREAEEAIKRTRDTRPMKCQGDLSIKIMCSFDRKRVLRVVLQLGGDCALD